eukprot:COSAG02_NODE_17_length_55377_cov_106.402258_32_plen_634_part_00
MVGPQTLCSVGQSTLSMADVEEWLGAALFKVLGEHLEALGVDELDDMSLLEPGQLQGIMDKLKPVQQTKFSRKLQALTGGGDAPIAAGATSSPQPSIPEGVAEKPAASEPEPELESTTRGIHSAGEATYIDTADVAGAHEWKVTPIPQHPKTSDFSPSLCIFGSMRFPVPPEARMLFAALQAVGVYLKIVDMAAGQDIDKEVYQWIEHCETFFVFGTKNYGEDTGNSACTYNEVKFAQAKRKTIILLRMIPWEDEFEELQARVLFNRNMLTLEWQQGQPMPQSLVGEVLKAIGQPMAGAHGSPAIDSSAAQATAAAEVARSKAEATQVQLQAEIARVEAEAAAATEATRAQAQAEIAEAQAAASAAAESARAQAEAAKALADAEIAAAHAEAEKAQAALAAKATTEQRVVGGYKFGDKVVSHIAFTSKKGNGSFAVGDVGTVVGPCGDASASKADQRVSVDFPDMRGNTNMLVTQIHRQGEAPELAGGYKFGDKVVSQIVFTSQKGNGSVAVGDVGTVIGPCGDASASKADQRVSVDFPDMRGNTNMLVTKIHRQGEAPELAGGYKFGDKVVSQIAFTSQKGNGSFAVGDVGTVTGPCGDASASKADQRVSVDFPDMGGNTNMLVTQIHRNGM